jgi:hypothetical protein
MPFFYLASVVLSLHISPTSAGGLRGQPVSLEDVEASLFAELANSYRSDKPTDHIANLEVALRQMYTAVPHEEDGSLNHAVVRYILHRFFVKEHGWFIRGLEPGTGMTNSTEGPQGLQDLQEWVPLHLQRFVEKIGGRSGVGLRDVTVIASTLDDLIHKEAVARLKQAFNALEFDYNVVLDEQQVNQVLDIWMMIYMVKNSASLNITGTAKIMKAHAIFVQSNRDWNEVQEWMHHLKFTLFPMQLSMNFNDLVRLVEEIGRRYANYNDQGCSKVKDELLSIESRKAGRVRLTEFYKKGLSGVFEFDEKKEYLRILGALDESDPNQTYVIVPNYVSSRVNCMVTSSFYAVCCRNECEDLMGSLEQQIAEEMARPSEILKIMSRLSTSTVASPRSIPESQANRLQSIADMHGGWVPLHSRLFAQWMHHAFPRECPYPHESGTTSPQTPDEWMQETGEKDSKASKEEMLYVINSDTCGPNEPVGDAARKHHDLAENELPWDYSEELLRPATQPRGAAIKPRSLFAFSSLALSFMVFAYKYALHGLSNGKKSDLPTTSLGPHLD